MYSEEWVNGIWYCGGVPVTGGGESPLIRLADNDNLPAARALLAGRDAGIHKTYIDAMIRGRWFLNVRRGTYREVEFYGRSQVTGFSALTCAVEKANLDFVKLLLSCGAKVFSPCFGIYFVKPSEALSNSEISRYQDCPDKSCIVARCPVSYAASSNLANILRQLMSHAWEKNETLTRETAKRLMGILPFVWSYSTDHARSEYGPSRYVFKEASQWMRLNDSARYLFSAENPYVDEMLVVANQAETLELLLQSPHKDYCYFVLTKLQEKYGQLPLEVLVSNLLYVLKFQAQETVYVQQILGLLLNQYQPRQHDRKFRNKLLDIVARAEFYDFAFDLYKKDNKITEDANDLLRVLFEEKRFADVVRVLLLCNKDISKDLVVLVTRYKPELSTALHELVTSQGEPSPLVRLIRPRAILFLQRAGVPKEANSTQLAEAELDSSVPIFANLRAAIYARRFGLRDPSPKRGILGALTTLLNSLGAESDEFVEEGERKEAEPGDSREGVVARATPCKPSAPPEWGNPGWKLPAAQGEGRTEVQPGEDEEDVVEGATPCEPSAPPPECDSSEEDDNSEEDEVQQCGAPKPQHLAEAEQGPCNENMQQPPIFNLMSKMIGTVGLFGVLVLLAAISTSYFLSSESVKPPSLGM